MIPINCQIEWHEFDEIKRDSGARLVYKNAEMTCQEHNNQKHTKEILRLTAIHRERTVDMVHYGATHAAIAKTVGCTRVFITRLMK